MALFERQGIREEIPARCSTRGMAGEGIPRTPAKVDDADKLEKVKGDLNDAEGDIGFH